MMREAIKADRLAMLNNENLRYSAVNPYALFRHGTLEFRSFRGTADMELIRQWTRLLLSFKDGALSFAHPVEMLSKLTTVGPDEFTAGFLSTEQIATLPANWQNKVMESVGPVQHVAGASEWLSRDDHKKQVSVRSNKKATTLGEYIGVRNNGDNDVRLEELAAQIARPPRENRWGERPVAPPPPIPDIDDDGDM
jgi:hypothetical protein